MRITITAAATAVLAIATIATTASGAQAASPSDATTEQMVAQVRAAAAHLKTAEDAIAAGYIPPSASASRGPTAPWECTT